MMLPEAQLDVLGIPQCDLEQHQGVAEHINGSGVPLPPADFRRHVNLHAGTFVCEVGNLFHLEGGAGLRTCVPISVIVSLAVPFSPACRWL